MAGRFKQGIKFKVIRKLKHPFNFIINKTNYDTIGGAYSAKKGDRDDEYFRFIVGSGAAIGAVDEAVKIMKEGGITQIIVPAELGYPVKGDSDHDLVGPKPTTFSGKQALNFVLDNQNLIDKTLLINVRLVRVDKKGSSQFKGN